MRGETIKVAVLACIFGLCSLVSGSLTKKVKDKLQDRVIDSPDDFQALSSDGTVNSVDELLAKYTNLKRIGTGAFGVVYKASTNGSTVAIKEIVLQGRDRASQRRAVKEVLALDCLKSHSPILQIHEAFLFRSGQRKVWIVTECLMGNLLPFSCLIKDRRRLDKHAVTAITKQLLEALAILANHKMVHRDIKAENVLVGFDGQVKLCDFGLCTTPLSTRVHKKQVGAVLYFAPERYKTNMGGIRCTHESDVYSLGVLAGTLWGDPFPGFPEMTEPQRIKKFFEHGGAWGWLEHEDVPEDGIQVLFKFQGHIRSRLTASQLLELPFFDNGLSPEGLKAYLVQQFSQLEAPANRAVGDMLESTFL